MKSSLLFTCSVCLAALLSNTDLAAQKVLQVTLPDIEIIANKVTKGDCDTYGLGDWKCTVKVVLDGPYLQVNSTIVFSENANDFTTIVGQNHQRIYVGELEKCRHCNVVLDEETGRVSGLNIGARGYRWYNGQGLIRKAYIQTDDFGCDEGHVGGTIRFLPLKILVDCAYATTED